MTGLDPQAALRLQRLAGQMHDLGPRLVYEALFQIGVDHGILPEIIALLGGCRRRLSPEAIRRLGGDRFPPRPLLVVPR